MPNEKGWMPTVKDMPRAVSAAKRVNVRRCDFDGLDPAECVVVSKAEWEQRKRDADSRTNEGDQA